MTKTYYECHITLSGPPHLLRGEVEKIRWKFSAIDGDPVMGDGVKCYATKHYNAKIPVVDILAILYRAVDDLIASGAVITRRKVELVIYDDRSDKVKPCDGGCVECHLDDLTGGSNA